MSLGDGNQPENLNISPLGDGSNQQQANLAGTRMSTEAMAFTPSFSGGGMGNEIFASSSGGADGGVDNPAKRLDKSKSVGQLIDAGVIAPIDSTAPATRNAGPADLLKPGESPQVTVTYADTNSGPNQKAPDFIVKQDGSIEAAAGNDPAAANKKDIVIQVERAPGSAANPDAGQQQSIDGLVNYLYGRLSDNPAVAQNGLKLNDQYGLISGDVSKQVGGNPAAESAADSTAAARQNFAPQTQTAMSQASRFTPGSNTQMSRGDVSQYVPERSEPRLRNESQSVSDIKNAIAAEFRPDAATASNKNAPYETSRMDRRGANEAPAVGRYGMSWSLFRGWFATNLGGDGDFTDDDIMGKMDALAKKGKVSKEFAAKFHNPAFAHKFVSAMHEMRDGHPPSAAQMRELMPPQFQEQVAADMVAKYSQTAGGDAGKVALAFHLGKSPDQLTAAENGDKGNQEYISSAKKFGQLSHIRDSMGANDIANVSVSKDGTELDARVKRAALEQANAMGGSQSKGECAAAVQLAWSHAGNDSLRMKGDGWQMHNFFQQDKKDFVQVSEQVALDAVRAGHVAIASRHWAVDHNGKDSGHVETLMADKRGNIIGASDFIGIHDPNNPRYNKTDYFLPRVDIENA